MGIELLHVFSPTLLNEFKFGFNRSTADTTNINQSGSPYSFAVSGFTNLNNDKINTGVGNTFSEIDNVTWIKGRHAVKAGIEIRRVQMNQGNTDSGTITYASTDAFAANEVSTASLAGTLPINGLRKTQYYGYIQDEFKWLPNLTLNLGARYSYFGLFYEVQGRANPFDFATCGPQGFCGVGASFGRPNYGDLDPRIALAWDPTNRGATVIRAGFGTYHEDGQLDDQNLPISNEVFSYSLSNKTIPDLSFPIAPFLVDTTGKVSPRDDDRLRKDTYVMQWGLSVQQQLPANFIGTISYVGSMGQNLLTLSEVNVIDPATGLRPYPDFGQVSWRGNRNNSNYEGLSVAAKRSFSRGLMLSANYMWSHEIDDGSNGSGDGDSLVPQNVNCQVCERADGIWDARHVFNANAVYQLPFGPGKPYLNDSGIWSKNRRVVGIDLGRRGAHRVSGKRYGGSLRCRHPDGNTNNQRPESRAWAFHSPTWRFHHRGNGSIPRPSPSPCHGHNMGNAPRDVARGPGVWQIDLGVGKIIPLTERVQLQFRTEFFNLFNHPQYGLPQAVISPPGRGSLRQHHLQREHRSGGDGNSTPDPVHVAGGLLRSSPTSSNSA